MFFSKIKLWQEESVLIKKSEARKECMSDSVLMFVTSSIATAFLGFLFVAMIYGGMIFYEHVSETFAVVSFVCTISLYFFLFYGVVVSLMSAVNSLYLFFKCLFTRVEDYDLAYKPSFRM